MTFDLPSLHLTTVHDQPVPDFEVPALVTSGHAVDGVFAADGLVLPQPRVARLRAARAVLAVQLGGPVQDLRIRIGFELDTRALTFWRKAHTGSHEPEVLRSVSDIGRHRTTVVSAQGRPRAVVSLLRRKGEKELYADLDFEVPAAELADGALLLEFADPELGEAWFTERLLPDGVAGWSIRSLEIAPAAAARTARSLAGLRTRPDGRDFMPEPTGFFVVNPDADAAATTLRLAPFDAPAAAAAPADAPAAPEARTGRLGRVGRVGRVGRRLVAPDAPTVTEPAAGEASRPLRVTATTLAGASTAHTAEPDGAGGWTLSLPACDQPVVVRPERRGRLLVDIVRG